MQEPYNQPQAPFVSQPNTPSGINKRTLWMVASIAAIVIVIGAVTTVALKISHQSGSPTAVAISNNVAQVVIGPTGYVPNTISIKKGQEITWTNKDSVPHHLSADQATLSGFDTPDPLEPGDSYTYIFETSGTYHYYDSSNPKTYVGTINVE